MVTLPQPISPPPGRWAFRGQSQFYGTLVPSFQRIFGQKRSHGAAEIIERDLIKTFRKHYAALQGRTPDMPSPDSIGTDYDLRCLSVMQHYGVPTPPVGLDLRFLDCCLLCVRWRPVEGSGALAV